MQEEGRRVRWERWVNTRGERQGETQRRRGKERRRARKRRGEATAIPDFHFNWTQRNIILNARNASETPIKRRRHFTLSPCTFVLIAGPIVAEVAIDYSSPEISRRNAPACAATRCRRIYIYIFRRAIACRRRWIAHESPRANFVSHVFNVERINIGDGCWSVESFAPNRSYMAKNINIHIDVALLKDEISYNLIRPQ